MSIDTSIKHGRYSRDLSIKFFKNNQLKETGYTDVLDAIESHDNKDYQAIEYNLLSILSIADDLDAFGFTGIFRYVEIYLRRGIKYEKAGSLILENAVKRFDNFIRTLGFADDFIQKHKKRYDVLVNFFNRYNEQVKSYQFGGQHPEGYCGVIEVLHDMFYKKMSLKDLFTEPGKYSRDPVILWYINGLASELS